MSNLGKHSKFDIVTEIGSFKKTASNIGEITYNGEHHIEVNEFIDFFEKIYALMGDKDFYMIHNIIHDIGSLTTELWSFINGDEKLNTKIKKSAIVITDHSFYLQVQSIIIQLDKDYKIKICYTKKQAYDWIRECIESESTF